MKNIALINALNLSDYAFKKVLEGESALERVYRYAKSLPDVEEIRIIMAEGRDQRNELRSFEGDVIEKSTVDKLFEYFRERARGFDNIFYFYGDTPFLDRRVTEKMYGDHRKYFAQYTFADGYPYGIAPEILDYEIVGILADMASSEGGKIERTSIFDVIKKDINAFDIETLLSPVDLRLLRVSLAADEKRNFQLIKRIFDLNGRDAESITSILQSKREILRTLPSFVSIQIVRDCPYSCSYCPYPNYLKKDIDARREMSMADFKRIIDMVESFSEDAYINLSLWGEPSFHPRIGEIMNYVLSKEKLKLVVETTGIGWQKSILETFQDREPIWIVSIDALNSDTYRHLKGEGFEESVETAEFLLERYPENTYIQAVRMKENEKELEAFYRHWKKKTNNVIIQKYDHFCQKLPDKRVTDLSPLKRFPCWHLQRDLYVLSDGTVPICREDLKREFLLGNILKEGIEKVWERGQEYYRDHVEGRYPEICKSCDEYYTYNF